MNKTYIATMGERFFMSKIAIATDSNSGITQAQGRELGIFVMPMPFYINDELFLEDITLSQEQFYQRLEEPPPPPLPPPKPPPPPRPPRSSAKMIIWVKKPPKNTLSMTSNRITPAPISNFTHRG